jgi:hypothetical protein
MKIKYIKIYSTVLLIGIFTFLASSSGESSSNSSNEKQDLKSYYESFDLKNAKIDDINNIIDIYGEEGKIISREAYSYGEGGVYDYRKVECYAEIELLKDGYFNYRTSSMSEKRGRWTISPVHYDLKMPKDYCCSESNYVTLTFELENSTDKALLILDEKYGPMLSCSDSEYNFNSTNEEPELRDLVNGNIFFVP